MNFRTRDKPHTHAPADWEYNGLPHGAWCRCCLCGNVGQSTVAFDYYANYAGDVLRCQVCEETPTTKSAMESRLAHARLGKR